MVSPMLFSLLINESAIEVIGKIRHGICFGRAEIVLFIRCIADD